MLRLTRTLSVGFTIFGLLFGSGNIVFPLNLGRLAGDNIMYSLLGLGISAVFVPLIGLVSCMLFDGSYKKFLGVTGRIPSQIIVFLSLMLIGPFAVIPRCIALSYSSVEHYFPAINLFTFSCITAVLIFALIVKKGVFLDLLGKVLGPLKLTLLLLIIIVGISTPQGFYQGTLSSSEAFMSGLLDGFQMLDLLGVIFFSGLIITAIRQKFIEEQLSSEKIAMIGLQGGVLGALMLGAVYTGFCYVAAMYGSQLEGLTSDRLLRTLAMIILGEKAAVIANITVAISCLTTATALASVFADYLRSEVLFGKINYPSSLLITVLISLIMANLGFSSILQVTFPLIVVLYPMLIVLSFSNIAHRLYGFKYGNYLVGITFIVSLIVKFFPF